MELKDKGLRILALAMIAVLCFQRVAFALPMPIELDGEFDDWDGKPYIDDGYRDIDKHHETKQHWFDIRYWYFTTNADEENLYFMIERYPNFGVDDEETSYEPGSSDIVFVSMAPKDPEKTQPDEESTEPAVDATQDPTVDAPDETGEDATQPPTDGITEGPSEEPTGETPPDDTTETPLEPTTDAPTEQTPTESGEGTLGEGSLEVPDESSDGARDFDAEPDSGDTIVTDPIEPREPSEEGEPGEPAEPTDQSIEGTPPGDPDGQMGQSEQAQEEAQMQGHGPKKEKKPVFYTIFVDADNNGEFGDIADASITARYYPKELGLTYVRVYRGGRLVDSYSGLWGETSEDGGLRCEFRVSFRALAIEPGQVLRLVLFGWDANQQHVDERDPIEVFEALVEEGEADRVPDSGDLQWAPVSTLGKAGFVVLIGVGLLAASWAHRRGNRSASTGQIR